MKFLRSIIFAFALFFLIFTRALAAIATIDEPCKECHNQKCVSTNISNCTPSLNKCSRDANCQTAPPPPGCPTTDCMIPAGTSGAVRCILPGGTSEIYCCPLNRPLYNGSACVTLPIPPAPPPGNGGNGGGGGDLSTNIDAQAKDFFAYQSFDEFIPNLLQIALILGAIAAFAFLVWGGIDYIISGGNQERVKTSKTIIGNALAGLAILAAVWIIWRLITYFLGLSSTVVGPFTIKLPSP